MPMRVSFLNHTTKQISFSISSDKLNSLRGAKHQVDYILTHIRFDLKNISVNYQMPSFEIQANVFTSLEQI